LIISELINEKNFKRFYIYYLIQIIIFIISYLSHKKTCGSAGLEKERIILYILCKMF